MGEKDVHVLIRKPSPPSPLLLPPLTHPLRHLLPPPPSPPLPLLPLPPPPPSLPLTDPLRHLPFLSFPLLAYELGEEKSTINTTQSTNQSVIT